MSDDAIDLMIFIAAPFLISAGFWLTPWLGVPTLMVLFPIWIGAVSKMLDIA